ncbi:MAG TPA: dolichyl-phosphate-mannose--protein mannosyltransferase, partial [Xanthomonadaceae bacterium]|nr:dolichyl-phosphate-mannose--protein mannosyltransferase [Xanthomonadaceae bacterium]
IALLILLPAGIASLRGWPRVRVQLRDRRFWLGPALFVLAIGLWLGPVLSLALGSGQPEYRAYLDDILLRQTAKRYAQSWDHAQPFWYHFATMATMWMPAILALPWALPAWWRRLRRRDPRYLLPLAWWLLVVLFFSIPSGKRDVYILPALPMFCLALAPLLPGLMRRPAFQRLLFAFAALVTLAFLGAGAAMLFGHPGFEQKIIDSRGVDGTVTRSLAWIMLAVGAWGGAGLLWWRVRRSALAVVSVLGAFWVLYGLLAYPVLNDSSSARGVMQAAGRRIGAGAQLGLVGWKEQNLLMADRPAQTFGFKVRWDEQLRRGVAWQAERPDGRWLLVQEAALLGCVDRSRLVPAGVANRRQWWLVPAAAITGPCQATAEDKRRELREQGKADAE